MVVNRCSLVMVRGTVVALLALLIALTAAGTAFAQDPDSPSSGTSAGGSFAASDAEATEESGPGAAEILAGVAMCGSPLGAAGGDFTSWIGDAVGVDLPSCKEGVTGAYDAGVDKVQDAAAGMAKGVVEETALWFGKGGVVVLKFALGWWITVDTVDASVFEQTVSQINDYTFYIQVAAFALSMILLGGRLALARSGMIRDTSEEGLKQMARATVVAGALSGLVVLATRVSDNLANWFMDGTVGSDPSRLAEAMVSIQMYGGSAGVSLLFVIGIIGILGGLVMAFLMLLRTGFLVLMTAALPIAGAAAGTKVGSQAYDKMLAWTIAWLLVKPVGAFVIGCAAMLFLNATPPINDPENGDALMALSGVILLCAAALVLPSLMRLIVPNVGALGGGGSGMAAAAGAVALGAKVGGMIATGGAGGAGAGAGAGAQAASTGVTPPTGAAPPQFGNAPGVGAGQQPQGNGSGNPGSGPEGNGSGTPSSGPEGNGSGTPGISSSGTSSGRAGQRLRIPVGATPQFHGGEFEI